VTEPTDKTTSIRLNLGSGFRPIDGYENLDIKDGNPAYPLAYADNSVDEIRASHLLEHFSHREVQAVIRDWVRVLKPGGCLKLAVPNFDWICAERAKGLAGGRADPMLIHYMHGSQSDEYDIHKCTFTQELLISLMRQSGMVMIGTWPGDGNDCSMMPVSLNLQGFKDNASVTVEGPKIIGVMSMPRITWTDAMFCVLEACLPLRIGVKRVTGAYWAQCLTRGIQMALNEKAEIILIIDYDTIFTQAQLIALLQLLAEHPEADAIAPVQVHRDMDSHLFVIKDDKGEILKSVPGPMLEGPLTKVSTAHFGLTVIRASALAKLKKPWFLETPDPRGEWEEGRIDADIHFWQNWEKCGLTLYQANRVHVGHEQTMVTWSGADWKPKHQYMGDYGQQGPPADVLAMMK
jgi:predicted SAM-dependent methyltransferase